MSDILEGLNERQQGVVRAIEGPVLVLAGAGSGKTRALTHRIAYMVRECGISPWSILAVTFTNKAANEMRQRVIKLLKGSDLAAIEGIFGAEVFDSHDVPLIGTFHSVCVRMLRKNIHLLDFENSFAIYDAADQLILMKRVMTAMSLDPKKVNPKAVLHQISMAKNQLIGPADYQNFVNDYFSGKVADIYPQYQDALKQANALDFDDILMKTVEVLQRFPEVKEYYQQRFRYICIDEYQDTNRAQYELVRLLAERYGNLCVIGDIDQSIYSWRGATIENILDFEKDYPQAQIFVLEENYRSTEVILQAANGLIQRNSQRKEKNLWTQKAGGEKIKHWLSENERHEAQMVAEEIMRCLSGREHRNFNEFTVLYRTNAQSRVFEEVFMRYGIPYKIIGGIRFYERKEIKDVLAYLRVIQNPNDTVSLLRIINTPSRKIGAKTIEMLQSFAGRNGISLYNALLLTESIEGFSAGTARILGGFLKLIRDLQALNVNNSAAAMIKYVVEMSGYKRMLNDGSVEGESRLENIGELMNVAAKYDRLEAGLSLNVFLEEVSLIADIDTLDEEDNAVTLMTVHSAKGLEFERVFIVGLEEGVFPHSRSMFDASELEEERRLMYVAMTRAMVALYLLHARSRTFYGETKSNAPSQFLEEVEENLRETNFGTMGRRRLTENDIVGRPIPVELDKGVDLGIEVGDKVRHINFGDGTIIDITGGVGTIAFDDRSVGVKKLALSVAPLKKI